MVAPNSSSSSSSSSRPKVVAVIGATGAQGQPVIKHLVQDGAYIVHALTRDPSHSRAHSLVKLGPEGHVVLVKGNAMQEDTIRSLFKGADAAFVNLDGFAMGERRETFWGARIFEIAQETGIKHYIWGSLDYSSLKTNWDPAFRTGHFDAKGRVTQFMKSFPSPTPWGVTWSVLISGPYLEMLNEFLSPLTLPDGTRCFAYPLGQKGRIPFIALDDLGYYARYMFNRPQDFSGKELEVATDLVSGHQLVETFTKVTGLKAEYVDISEATYLTAFDNTTPAGYDDKYHQPGEDPPMTFSDNFRGFWRMWRADCLSRDFEELSRIHPNRLDLAGWMTSTGYKGTRGKKVLKNLEDNKTRPLRIWSLIRTAIRGLIAYWRGGVDGFKSSITTIA